MRITNLHQHIPAELPDELFTTLAAGRSVRIERIVSRGHSSPPDFFYDQDEAEFILLVSGEAELELQAGEKHHLRPGDCLTLPAHVRHRVSWTTPDRDTIWLAVFYPEPVTTPSSA